MRNIYLFLVLIIHIAGCSQTYRSKIQAENACKKWASKGGTWGYLIGSNHKNKTNTLLKQPMRFCISEEVTKQYLGHQRINTRKDFVYYNSENCGESRIPYATCKQYSQSRKEKKSEIKKNFYY